MGRITRGADAYRYYDLQVPGGAAVSLIPSPAADYAPNDPGGWEAEIGVEGNGIRFRADGIADPTADSGRFVARDDGFELHSSRTISNCKVIGIGGTATLRVHLFRY